MILWIFLELILHVFFVFFCVKLTHEPCVFVCVSVSFKINTTTLYFSLYNVREKQDIAIISLKIILKNDVYGSNIFSQNNLGAFTPPLNGGKMN